MAHLMYFLLNTEKNRPSLGKIFKCIWKVLFGPFTKYYGLWSSDLTANCQNLKIQDFTSPLLTQQFIYFFLLFYYYFFFRYFYSQYLRNSYVQSLLNILFSARTRWDLPRVRKDTAKTVTRRNFRCYQEKINEISHFRHFKSHNSGSKHDN